MRYVAPERVERTWRRALHFGLALAALCLVLQVWWSGWLTKPAHGFLLYSSPSGAEVFTPTIDLRVGSFDKPLGVTPGPLRLSRAELPCTLVVRHRFYQSETLRVTPDDVEAGSWGLRVRRTVTLTPSAAWVGPVTWVLAYPFLLAGGAVVVGLALLWRWVVRHREAHQAFVEQLQAGRVASGGVLGAYRLGERLGQGGMATVYEARAVDGSGPALALKVVSPQLARDPDFLARFQQEVRLTARLQHPGAVFAVDWGYLGDIHYLVMEKVEGESLSARLKPGPLAVSEAVDCLTQIAEALDYAHRNEIVHRDLKPSNVLIEPGGRVRLMDFGIAFSGDCRNRLTQAGDAFGTPGYMSPEQILGQPLDFRTDLYSLGVLAYEVLTGSPPFTAPTALALINLHLTQDPPPLPDSLPEGLRRLVDQLLAKQAQDRPASAAEVVASLRALG